MSVHPSNIHIIIFKRMWFLFEILNSDNGGIFYFTLFFKMFYNI